ncbi:C-X-C chemokine receptor type 3-like protein [Labeo rohita]|uniref:C-X-C chemokine receptor type 3-like protein n=1 Tax=Labeo rohita TaxID=84645 RepID=A0A498NDW1_LABRO|nr:C-X-C chemokine receptor type 3-like protein [Labeo rohita]
MWCPQPIQPTMRALKMMNADTKITMADYNKIYSENYESHCDKLTVCDQESSMYFHSIFIPVLYSLALIVGLVGNGLVMVVLWKKRQSMNATDILILHLSLADILLLLTLPFWAVEAVKGWIFGTVFCKLIGALFKINFYGGIFMLSGISLDCYLSIVHGVQMYSHKKKMKMNNRTKITISMEELNFSSDYSYNYSENYDESCCGELIINFYCGIFMLTCISLDRYLSIVHGVQMYSRKKPMLRRSSQCKQKKRAIRVIVALVVAFFIHWTPYNITLIADTKKANNAFIPSNQASCKSTTTLDIALTVTSTLAYLHCCVNPMLFVALVLRKSSVWL